ncbi:thiol peroxidase [Neobacillus sp. 114]|uniref:thiol peroxidase n=1 Tax=Neobacillus sp. 114 TaxID=3048535 RepID=UPI0024C217F4|nr:thiol peroxidase [Neobacillus sp. 114]
MIQEQTRTATLAGNPVTLLGPEIKVGDQAPDFTVLANDRSTVTLADSYGKVRLISVVPSLDTGVCDQQTRRFNEAVSELGDNVVVLTISADLPFAQSRWCGAAGISGVQTLSDHFEMSFSTAYGTYIKELRLNSRAVFVVNAENIVTYVEYLSEVTNHPNYEAALEAAKAAAK